MRCSTCSKELKEDECVTWRECSFCKSPICLDCIRYTAIRRQGLYKEYIDTIPVCKDCTPKKRLDEKLARIVDEILGRS
jgi:hypothetical protein